MTWRVSLAAAVMLVAACEGSPSSPKAVQVEEPVARAQRPQDVIVHAEAQTGVMRAMSNAVGAAYRQGAKARDSRETLPPQDLLAEASVLSVVFSGNTHGEVDDCGCKSNPLGGVARRATLIDAVPEGELWASRPWKPEGVMAVDAGDLLFKTATLDRAPQASKDLALHEAQTLVEALNAARPAAVAAGELDFALGIKPFKALVTQAEFPWISANLYEGKDRLLPGHVVVEVGGRRVALLGLTRAEASRAEYWTERGLRVEDPAKAYVSERASVVGADLVILLSNLGVRETEKLVTGMPLEQRPDLVFLSNSNSLTREPIWADAVPMFEPLSQGKMVGRVDVLLRGSGRPEWMNRGVDVGKVGQAYRRAWSNYVAARQRVADVRRDQAEQELQLSRLAEADKAGREKITRQQTFLTRELERAENRLALVSEELLKAGTTLEEAQAGANVKATGDDWVDVQVADVKLSIPGLPAVQKVVDRRAKKRPAGAQ